MSRTIVHFDDDDVITGHVLDRGTVRVLAGSTDKPYDATVDLLMSSPVATRLRDALTAALLDTRHPDTGAGGR